MSPAFVLDCSLTMSWFFPDEATAESAAILDRLGEDAVVVPAHWYLEITNVLSLAEKRRRSTPAQSTEFLSRLSAFDIEVDHEAPTRAFAYLIPLCRSLGLTAYDAAYLDLAIRRRLPLASLDDDLRKQAKARGLELLGR